MTSSVQILDVPRLVSVTLLALSAVVAARPVDAEDRSVRDAVRQLAASGEKNTPAALAESRLLYEKAKRLAPTDNRVELTYAVVLFQQRRYSGARALLTRYLEGSPDDLEARILKLRVALQDRHDAEALEYAVVLAKKVGRERSVPDAQAASVASFLGTVFSYFELARGEQKEAAQRMEQKNQILSALGTKRIEDFDAGRAVGAKAIAAIVNDIDAERVRIERLSGRRVEETRSEIDATKKKLADQDDKAQSSSDSASEAEREAAVLQLQLSSQRDDRARVAARFAILQTQLQMVLAPTSSSGFADLTTPGSRLPVFSSTTTTVQIPLDRLAQANALSLQLAAVNKQAFDMDRKILALQARLAEVTGERNKSEQDIESSDAESRRLERKARTAEKQLKQKPRTSNAKIAALKAQLTNFSTYAPFDYEAEKARVLKMFDE